MVKYFKVVNSHGLMSYFSSDDDLESEMSKIQYEQNGNKVIEITKQEFETIEIKFD